MTWMPNKNKTATNSSVALNATTFTQLAAGNPNRLFFSVANDTSVNVWVNLCTAADGVDNTGIWLPAGSIWQMSPDGVYTGEISAIAASGTPSVKVCYY